MVVKKSGFGLSIFFLFCYQKLWEHVCVTPTWRKGREDGRRNSKGIIRQWEESWRRENRLGGSGGNCYNALERDWRQYLQSHTGRERSQTYVQNRGEARKREGLRGAGGMGLILCLSESCCSEESRSHCSPPPNTAATAPSSHWLSHKLSLRYRVTASRTDNTL